MIKVDGFGQRIILCSTDLTLSLTRVLELYELRFQIEFLFRDAKQHTGLGPAKLLILMSTKSTLLMPGYVRSIYFD